MIVGAKNSFDMRLPKTFDWFVVMLDRTAKLDITAPLSLECSIRGYSFLTGMDIKYGGFTAVNALFLTLVLWREWRARHSEDNAARAAAKGEAERLRYMWIAFKCADVSLSTRA